MSLKAPLTIISFLCVFIFHNRRMMEVPLPRLWHQTGCGSVSERRCWYQFEHTKYHDVHYLEQQKWTAVKFWTVFTKLCLMQRLKWSQDDFLHYEFKKKIYYFMPPYTSMFCVITLNAILVLLVLGVLSASVLKQNTFLTFYPTEFDPHTSHYCKLKLFVVVLCCCLVVRLSNYFLLIFFFSFFTLFLHSFSNTIAIKLSQVSILK